MNNRKLIEEIDSHLLGALKSLNGFHDPTVPGFSNLAQMISALAAARQAVALDGIEISLIKMN